MYTYRLREIFNRREIEHGVYTIGEHKHIHTNAKVTYTHMHSHVHINRTLSNNKYMCIHLYINIMVDMVDSVKRHRKMHIHTHMHNYKDTVCNSIRITIQRQHIYKPDAHTKTNQHTYQYIKLSEARTMAYI